MEGVLAVGIVIQPTIPFQPLTQNLSCGLEDGQLTPLHLIGTKEPDYAIVTTERTKGAPTGIHFPQVSDENIARKIERLEKRLFWSPSCCPLDLLAVFETQCCRYL